MTNKMFFLTDLYEVQQEALRLSGDQDGFCFFMEPGLGKTRTVLYEFHFKVVRELVDVLFVVVPRTLRGTWRDEAVELGFPYPIILMDSDKKTFDQLNKLGRQPVIIVAHYEQMLTHAGRVLTAMLERKKRVYLALDESVRIKKHTSVIGDMLYLLGSAKTRIKKGKSSVILDVTDRIPAAFRRVLSGTPAPQGPHDLWMQFRFIGKMDRWPYHGFRNLFCRMSGFMGKKIVGSQNLDILRQKTGHFVFRAKKTDWTDLPEKIWSRPREVELTPGQRRAYLEIMHDFVLELGPNDFVTVEMAITVKTKLQQIASGWVYDNEKNVREIVPLEDNPKLQECAEVVNSVGSKILVFYFFRPTRDYLERLAEQHEWKAVFLESGLKDAELDRRKAQFNEDDETTVAFCQIDAIKEGHTLLGTENNPCHNTLFLENTYNLYARQQGEDRNHRHGQKYPVVYHDIASSKEDKDIIKALQRKEGMQEQMLSEFTALNPNLKTEKIDPEMDRLEQ